MCIYTTSVVFFTDISNYELRRYQLDVLVPSPKIELYKRSLNYSGAILWNNLPADIREEGHFKGFKAALRSYQVNALQAGSV